MITLGSYNIFKHFFARLFFSVAHYWSTLLTYIKIVGHKNNSRFHNVGSATVEIFMGKFKETYQCLINKIRMLHENIQACVQIGYGN